MASRRLTLEKIVLLDDEVVHELYAHVRLGLDVVFDVDHAIYFDVDGEAICSELGRYFLVNLNKHIMAALHDRLL